MSKLPHGYPEPFAEKASGKQCQRCKQIRRDVMVELCPRCIDVLVQLRDSGDLKRMMPDLDLDKLLDAEYTEYRRQHESA